MKGGVKMNSDPKNDYACRTVRGRKIHRGRNGLTLCGQVIDLAADGEFWSYAEKDLCKKCRWHN